MEGFGQKSRRRKKAVLGRGTLSEIRSDRRKMYVPSWIQQVPPEVGSARAGKLTADQWRTFITINLVVTLIRLWGALPPENRFRQMLDNLMDLVTAVKISHMRSLSHEQIDQYTKSMHSYLAGVLILYPHARLVIKHHLALHLSPLFRRFGPTHAWRTFPFERINLVLQRTQTNSHIGTKISYLSHSAEHLF
jgi:hypothetical protein